MSSSLSSISSTSSTSTPLNLTIKRSSIERRMSVGVGPGPDGRVRRKLHLDPMGMPPPFLVVVEQDTLVELVVPVSHSSSTPCERPSWPTPGSCLVRIETNAPRAPLPFVRSAFRVLDPDRMVVDVADGSISGVIDAWLTGSFEYRVVLNGEQRATGTLVVTPHPAVVRPGLAQVPHAITTVLTKCMGPLDRWERVLSPEATAGYSAIHFTPPQVLGDSGSAYAIADQLTPAPAIGDWDRLKAVLGKLRTTSGLRSVVDVVWNHTASSSPWLRREPSVGFSLTNSPHLAPAFVLDEALARFSSEPPEDVAGVVLDSEEAIASTLSSFRTHCIEALRMWEFYILDVEGILGQLHAYWNKVPFPHSAPSSESRGMDTVHKAEILRATPGGVRTVPGARFPVKVNLPLVLSLCGNEEEARPLLDLLNLPYYKEYDAAVASALASLEGTLKWERLNPAGPHTHTPVSAAAPLASPYFTRLWDAPAIASTGVDPSELEIDELIKSPLYASHVLANNGWVAGSGVDTPDFAGPQSNAYFTRSIHIWGDLVKLRYGRGEADSPILWARMKSYTRIMARVFDGFRIDNAHSTPVHVAQALLDVAREVEPRLYVVAELFTPPEREREFVANLGVNALVREGLHATSPEALSALLHKYSGCDPVGSLPRFTTSSNVLPSVPSAIVYDVTHDNPSVVQECGIDHVLGLAVLTAMTGSASGSTWGYDWVVPAALNVVTESRLYPIPDPEFGFVLSPFRKAIRELAEDIGESGFSEMHVEAHGDVVALTRAHPVTHEAILVVVRTPLGGVRQESLAITGHLTRLEMCASLSVPLDSREHFAPETDVVNGLDGAVLNMRGPYETDEQHGFVVDSGETPLPVTYHAGEQVLDLSQFPVGSVAVFSSIATSPESEAGRAAAWLDDTVLTRELDNPDPSLSEAVSDLCGLAINVVLYRCETEEADALDGARPYHVPGDSGMVYAGLTGFVSVLQEAEASGDLGAPICNNLREGNWALDFVVNRLDAYESAFGANLCGLSKFRTWLGDALDKVGKLPRALIPQYFYAVLVHAVAAVRSHALVSCSTFVKTGSAFVQDLAMTAFQVYGPTPSSPTGSLAAGLPHFASGFMREWGRDTFIAVRGLFLVTGRLEVARHLLVSFARVTRHGLIPNLYDGGSNPRFNARDAAWWFAQAVVEYDAFAEEEDRSLFEKSIELKYPWEGAPPRVSLVDVVVHILAAHVNGISFREVNAGPQLDSHMSSRGFDVSAWVDPETGFIHGGSEANCGTWMDKMGSSSQAGNDQVPATPRDGAAIELTGLASSVLAWIIDLDLVDSLPVRDAETAASWGLPSGSADLPVTEWLDRIQGAFWEWYGMGEGAGEVGANAGWGLVQGGLKDLVGSSHPWTDWQIRPNAAVALAVGCFGGGERGLSREQASGALGVMSSRLVGLMGMRTLDPEDRAYSAVYNNSDGSDNYMLASGFNYHQGPEWVWPLGYFLRALVRYAPEGDLPGLASRFGALLRTHQKWIRSSRWQGMPELVNPGGEECVHSCPTQAWSSSTLLDALYDLWVKVEG